MKVPSAGPLEARIMIVGEAPGETEEQRGRPFVGASGYLLDQMCHEAGILRSDCYVTNVVKYRPKGNDISHFLSEKECGSWKRHSVSGLWLSPEAQEGVAELESEIARLQPNVIVALGNIPLTILTAKRGIGNYRGSVMAASGSSKVVPTYHPAAILRNYPWRWDAVQDLRRAKSESLYPEVRKPEWRFHLSPTLNEVLAFLSRLGESVVCDIETRRRQITCVGVGDSKNEAMCIPIFGEGGSYWRTVEEEFLVVRALLNALTKRKVINQNFIYDAFYIAALWGRKIIPVFDTMIAQGVLFPGFPKALDYLASLHCQYYEYWKHDSKEWSGRTNYHDLWYYNCQDIVYTWEVAESLRHCLTSTALQSQFDFEMSLFAPCLNLMLRGVNSNAEQRHRLSAEMLNAMNARTSKLAFYFGRPVNPRSPTQLKQLFYTDLGIEPIRKRATRKNPTPSVTTDDEALEKLKVREPLLATPINLIQDLRTMTIFRSNFLECESPDNRFYTGVNIVGAKTFRFSNSANPMYYGTNLQNVPKFEEDDPSPNLDLPDIRKLFIPDEGYTLAEFDLSKADLRVVVWESDEPELKQMLKEGVNIYKEAGTKITGMPYRKAKSFIHGTDYGGKAPTLAATCGITRHQAELAQRKWFSAYPGILEWHKRVGNELATTGGVANKFGFRIIFAERLENCFTEALAWVPQSTVAIVINKVLRRFYHDLELRYRHSHLLLQVHDSILTQIQNAYVCFVIPAVLSFFQQVIVPYDDPLIIPADCKYGAKSWAELEKWDAKVV